MQKVSIPVSAKLLSQLTDPLEGCYHITGSQLVVTISIWVGNSGGRQIKFSEEKYILLSSYIVSIPTTRTTLFRCAYEHALDCLLGTCYP